MEPKSVIHTEILICIGCGISAGTIVNLNIKIGFDCYLNCGSIVASSSMIQGQTKTQYYTRIL